MSSFENHNMAFNLEFYKWIRLCHLFDPNDTRIFNCHFPRLAVAALVVLAQLIIIFGAFGINGKTEETINTTDFIILLNIFISNFGVAFKISSFIYKAKNVWKLLDVTRIDFLKSRHSLQSKNKLKECRKKFVFFSYYVIGLTFMMLTLWVVCPIITRIENMNQNVKKRYENIYNLWYPVNTNTYNQYFCVFYVIEAVITLYFSLAIIIDFFILSICIVITIQYEVLADTFSTVRVSENEDLSSKAYTYFEDFKSILIDQKKLYLKLKLFYSIVRPIVLSNVVFYSTTEIVFTYAFIEIFKSPKTETIFSIVKVAMTTSFLIMQLFLYCYVFEILDEKVMRIFYNIITVMLNTI